MTEQQRKTLVWGIAVAIGVVLIIVWAGWPASPPPAIVP